MIKFTQRDKSGTNDITLELAKAHMRVSGTADDTLITSLIDQSRVIIEDYTDRSLVANEIAITISPRESIVLPLEPVTSNSIEVTDLTTSESVEYTYDGLELVLDEDIENSLSIYYETYPNVPDGLKLGWLEVIAFLYDNRGDLANLQHFLLNNTNVALYRQKIWV